jgi:NAD(P)-dependent dehydrogenase (short-subunit alcohol dehydrogenase family)
MFIYKNRPSFLLKIAGIMFGPRHETIDGFESQMATNHLSHFLLSKMLLPKLIQAGTASEYSRIVNVSSAAHMVGSWTDFEDLNSK